jgi:membrane protein DedA with SNARE-associated domain
MLFFVCVCYTTIYMQEFIIMIQSWIGDYGFWGVLGAGIVEEIISPIPSSLVQGFAGVILFAGQAVSVENVIRFIITVPVASAIGVTIGSLPYVWLSRTIGLSIVDKYGKYIGVTMQDIDNLNERMKKTTWDEWLFVGLRAFPLIPNVALAIYGGLTKMPLFKYIILSMAGVFIRGTIVGGMGWLAGNVITDFSRSIDVIEKIGFFGLIALIIGWIVWKNKKIDKDINSV